MYENDCAMLGGITGGQILSAQVEQKREYMERTIRQSLLAESAELQARLTEIQNKLTLLPKEVLDMKVEDVRQLSRHY